MAKLVSLKTWVLVAVFLFVFVEAATSVGITIALSKWPYLQQYYSGLTGFLSTRILALLVWSIIAGLLLAWRFFWHLPVIGQRLSDAFFPILHGDWTFVVESNWPIIERLKDSAASKKELFDVLSEKTVRPELSSYEFTVRIKQSWFSTIVEFLGDDGTVLDHSRSLAVELLQETETEPKRIVWTYRQQNKQGAGSQLSLSDEAQFLGAAVMRVEESGALNGHYWTNRSWQKGLNAAGVISGTRKQADRRSGWFGFFKSVNKK